MKSVVKFVVAVVLASVGLGCSEPPPPVEHDDIVRLRRLSHRQYARAVRDLFGAAAPELAALPPQSTTPGAMPPEVTAVEVDAYRRAARRIAAEYPGRAPCDADDLACHEQFVAQLVRRVLRRPVEPEALAPWMARYHEHGIGGVLSVLLQAPEFLYVIETGRPGGETTLDDWALATRMALLLWQSVPDDALLDAASRGALRDPNARRVHARRMLADPRAAAMIRDELRVWALPDIDALDKSDAAFSGPLREAYREQFDRFVDDVLAQSGGLTELLSHPSVPVDPRLAPIYGLHVAEDDGWTTIEPPEHRFGVLTLPGFLAVHARADDSSPVYRGLFVRRRLLCQSVDDPPPGVMPVVSAEVAGGSNRSRYEQHARDPACRGCHEKIDGPGFAFESFDVLGRLRVNREGQPLDTSGQLLGTERDADFVDLAGLAGALAEHPEVHRCWARGWAQRALPGSPGLGPLVDTLAEQSLSGGSLRDMLVEIVGSERFARVVAEP